MEVGDRVTLDVDKVESLGLYHNKNAFANRRAGTIVKVYPGGLVKVKWDALRAEEIMRAEWLKPLKE